MTQDEIIEIAQGCGLVGMRPYIDGIYVESLVAFAKLVAEAERDACADISHQWSKREDDVGGYIEAAIRARGQA